MAAANEEQLKSQIEAAEKTLVDKINTYFQHPISPEGLVWEIVPDYFIFKLPNLKINFVCIKTNIAGDRIDFSFYVIDHISLNSIVNICEVVDVVLKSISDKWSPTSYTSETIAKVTNINHLVKYKLSAINYSGTNFAKGNVFITRYLR